MTVPTTSNRVSYACDGVTTVFAFTFKAYNKADLQVILGGPAGSETILTLDVDYSVSVSAPGPGGTVTLIGSYAATPPASGYTLTIYRELAMTQLIDLVHGDAMPPDTLEEGYDRAVMLIQQLSERIGRSILLPVSSQFSGLTLPAPDASKFLRWNSSEDGLENATIADSSVQVINEFWQAVLAASGSTLDDALSAMGLPVSDIMKTLLAVATAKLARETLLVMGHRSSDYANLAAALTAIGSAEATLIVDSTLTVGADATIPANVSLEFLSPGKLSHSTYTITVNGRIKAGRHQIFDGTGTVTLGVNVAEVYPEWFGNNASPGTTDMTSAFSKALAAMPTGGRLTIGPTTYLITSGLTVTKNRITVEGAGLSSLLNFTPAADSAKMWVTDGNKDNLVFRNFAMTLTNPATRDNIIGFEMSSDDNSTTFERLYIAGFNKYGIHLTNSMYDRILRCRFTDCDNSADGAYLAQAIRVDGYAYNLIIRESRFGQNDIAITVNTAGGNVVIEGNSFELNGDSGNAAGISHTVYLENVKGAKITGNYFEANYTGSGTAVIRCDNCLAPEVSNNIFSGNDGGTIRSYAFVRFYGSGTRYPAVKNNWMEEVTGYFVMSSSAVVKCHGNYYYDGGAELTTHAAIMTLMSSADLIELDIPVLYVWDPPSLVDGSGTTSGDVAVAGARHGDRVVIGNGSDVNECLAVGYVWADNIVRIRLQNESGVTRDLASSTWKVQIFK